MRGITGLLLPGHLLNMGELLKEPISQEGKDLFKILIQSSKTTAIDDQLIHFLGDPRLWASEASNERTYFARNAVRHLTVSVLRSGKNKHIDKLVAWISSEPSVSGLSADMLQFLRADSAYVIATGASDSSTQLSYSHVPAYAVTALNNLLIRSRTENDGWAGSGLVNVEIQWMVVSHPDSPATLLSEIPKDDPRWPTAAAHRNYPISMLRHYLDRILRTSTDAGSEEEVVADVMALTQNPQWAESDFDFLWRTYRNAPAFPALRIAILEDPRCPIWILNENEEGLSEQGLINLVSRTHNNEQLLRIASTRANSRVSKAIIENPISSEEVRVIAALSA